LNSEGTESSLGSDIRDGVRAELEATRTAYHALLGSISVADWRKTSGNPAWTIGEVLFHMTLALRLLPSDVRLIRGSGWAPKLPASLFNWLNVAFTRWGARKLTQETVAEKYDEAHDKVLCVLETILDDEWEKGAEYPSWDPLLSGHVTLERLFHYPAIHFQSHAQQVRSGLVRDSAGEEERGVR